MGPAGICIALYPPRPSGGSRVRFPSIFVLHSCQFSYFYVLTVTHWHIVTIKVLYLHWLFLFVCQYSLDTILWYRLQVYFMLLLSISFDIRTARVRCGGAAPPPPGHVPPAGKAVLPGVLCEHMCSCWSYVTVHYWMWECGCIEA